MPDTSAQIIVPAQARKPVINLDAIRAGEVFHEPYRFMVAHGVVSRALIPLLDRDFPKLEKPGFLPLQSMSRQGVFDQLIREVESPEIAAVISEKLGVNLNDKPRIITVRKWSAGNDGRIHVDGKSKIVTSLIYLNETWPEGEDGGRFRVLNSDTSFDDCAAEVLPLFGTFVAFVRSDDSWHGHKPFTGERRVVQTAWLRSEADFERKKKRGKLALFLKNMFLPTSR